MNAKDAVKSAQNTIFAKAFTACKNIEQQIGVLQNTPRNEFRLMSPDILQAAVDEYKQAYEQFQGMRLVEQALLTEDK